MNPGNPYIGSRTENGFGTFGGPDFAATLAEVATRALKAVWYQKWQVHLRPRPEHAGGLVHLIKTGQGSNTTAKLSNVILNSQGLQQSFNKHGSWLLSQAFPEGSPTHPSYPTGHGVVGGACITVLKFFFDGNFVIPNPVVPADDGLSLDSYTGADAGQLTVNGELNKLGHNVSFGHGIHSGIHWRSDTDVSLKLGEAVALSILHDKAQTYNEKFTVQLTKFDGHDRHNLQQVILANERFRHSWTAIIPTSIVINGPHVGSPTNTRHPVGSSMWNSVIPYSLANKSRTL